MFSRQVRPDLNLSEERNEISLTVGKYQTLYLYMKLKQSESGCLTKEQMLLTLRQTDHIFWTSTIPLTPEQQLFHSNITRCLMIQALCELLLYKYNCWTSTSVIPPESRVWKHIDTSLLYWNKEQQFIMPSIVLLMHRWMSQTYVQVTFYPKIKEKK